MENEINIKIYRNGEYSVRDNVELKLHNMIARQSQKALHYLQIVDNYFVNH